MPGADYTLLDRGYTSAVYRIAGTRRVCKSFLPECAATHFPAEVSAYERFAARAHPTTIPKYYGVDACEPAGIVLELVPNGNLYRYLHTHGPPPPEPATLYRWARQAAEGLAFAHECGVFHSDIYCSNFLLDENLDLKVADFAGASIDGSMSWSFYRTTHLLPGTTGKSVSAASEIFALGSALYYMVTGHDLFFPELDYEGDKAEIVRRLREREFPATAELQVLGAVIRRCWHLEHASMAEVVQDISAESSAYEEVLRADRKRSQDA